MIIDEKGRVFGKINIIDLAVIVFLLFMLPFFYYAHKLYKEGGRRTQYIQEKIKSECKSTIDELQRKYDNLQTENLRIANEHINSIDELQRKYDNLQTENLRIANEHINSINEYNNLKAEHGELKSEYIGLQDKVNSYLKKHKRAGKFFN